MRVRLEDVESVFRKLLRLPLLPSYKLELIVNIFLDPETAREFDQEFNEPGPSTRPDTPVARSPTRDSSTPSRIPNLSTSNSGTSHTSSNSNPISDILKGSKRKQGSKAPASAKKPKPTSSTHQRTPQHPEVPRNRDKVSKDLFNKTSTQKPTTPSEDTPGTTNSAQPIGENSGDIQQVDTPQGPRHNTKAGNRKIQKSWKITQIQV